MRNVLELSALFSFLVAVLVAALGSGIFFLIALLSPMAGIMGEIILFTVVFVASFAVFAIVGLVIASIPKAWALPLGVVVLIVGLLLLQPEIAVLGMYALLLAMIPGDRRALAVSH